MLPPKLKALRRALHQTQPTGSRETPAALIARRAAETLSRARAGETDAAGATLTPAEFRKFYGYERGEAPRMRQCAELLAYCGGSGGSDHRLEP